MKLNKLTFTSASHTDFTLDSLRQLVPSAFTEVRDANGQLNHKIDFDVLRELLGDAILDTEGDRFGFYWVGKQDAKRAAAEPIHKTLRPIIEDSVDWDTTGNLYIEGDNLDVLKLLQRAYLGKVKMIYIDPPYNTGNDFVYQDNFSMTKEELDEATGNIDEEGYRLRSNPKTHQRYHSDWCSMMYSRLLVARTLLANDGVIFISIDDNEVHHLRKICDEVFGEENFVATIAVNRASEIATENTIQKHEYLECYSKNISTFKVEGLPKYSISRGTVGNENQTMPIITFPKGLKCYGIADGIYNETRKIEGSSENIENLDPIVVENETLMNDVRMKAKWRSSNDMRNFFQNNCQPTQAKINGIIEEIYFENDRFNPQIKKATFEKLPSLFLENKRGSKYLEDLGLKGVFDNPKDVKYISKMIQIVTNQNDIILDFFSGSATTAHAVMQLNAEDGGNRKYICVQLPEETPEKSEARKAGYSTICSIAKERIRRAGKKIKEAPENKDKEIDTGFRVLRVDSSNMEDVYYEPTSLSQENLFTQIDSVKNDRTELDLLFGCMVDWGVELSYPLRTEQVAGKTLHIVNEGALVACFDRDIDSNSEVVHYIAKMKPLRIIFHEVCFTTDADKLNIYEQFKQLCGWNDDEAYKRIYVI